MIPFGSGWKRAAASFLRLRRSKMTHRRGHKSYKEPMAIYSALGARGATMMSFSRDCDAPGAKLEKQRPQSHHGLDAQT